MDPLILIMEYKIDLDMSLRYGRISRDEYINKLRDLRAKYLELKIEYLDLFKKIDEGLRDIEE